MEQTRNFFIFVFVGLFLLLVQQSGVISFLGVRADFLLVFFAFLSSTRHRILEYFSLLALLFIFFLLEGRFWVPEISFFCLVAIAMFFLYNRLPGRFFSGFLILFIGGTCALFFGMPVWKEFLTHGFNFSSLSFPPYRVLVIELILNFLVGMFFILIGTRRFLSNLFHSL